MYRRLHHSPLQLGGHLSARRTATVRAPGIMTSQSIQVRSLQTQQYHRQVARRLLQTSVANGVVNQYNNSRASDEIIALATAAGALLLGGVLSSSIPQPTSFENHDDTNNNGNHSTAAAIIRSNLPTSLTSTATTLQCDAAAAASAEFELFTALDARDELEKVRMAQILHDLHELATSSTTTTDNDEEEDSTKAPAEHHATETKKPRGLRKFVTMIRTMTRRRGHKAKQQQERAAQEEHHAKIGDCISFDDYDLLTEICPDEAMRMIEAISAGSTLDVENLHILLETATHVLQQEPNLLKLDEDHHCSDNTDNPKQQVVSVIGDLHGSLTSLTHILQVLDVAHLREKPYQKIVFNGDFVDRGQASLEVLLTLLLLKLAFPQQIYLIRGNHEDTHIASVYGFQDEIRRKYGDAKTKEVWTLIGQVFGALPIALQTQHALVLHGGLPSADFDLTTLQKMPVATRLSCASTVSPKTETERLLCNILWSDPTPTDAQCMEPNPRGLGVMFGSKVAQDFLKRNHLSYLVRGHEVVAEGVRDMDCGQGTAVITVFSAAAYPSDAGSNQGGILHLHADGTHTQQSYSLRDTNVTCDKVMKDSTEHALDKVRTLIKYNNSKLKKAFGKQRRQQQQQKEANGSDHAEDDRHLVTVEQWAQIMSETIQSAGLPWLALQPHLAPTYKGDSSFSSFVNSLTHANEPARIDVDEFLSRHSLNSSLGKNKELKNHEAEALAQNQEMLLTVFKFLDTNGDGTLSPEEFKTGVDLLNKRMPKDRQLQNPQALFQNLDEDGNGEITLEEFMHGFGMVS